MTSFKLLFVDKSVPFRNVLTYNISTQVKLVEKKDSLDNIDLSTVEQVGFIWKNQSNVSVVNKKISFSRSNFGEQMQSRYSMSQNNFD